MYFEEPFTPDERTVLSRYFTNLDGPVFALINLPEVVKGALFARYSRTHKSLRRLLLDEFLSDSEHGIEAIAGALPGSDQTVATAKAEALYQRVFSEYGDDSVAQLGGVHLACEQASNLLTKVLERGRLAAYLEQSTRYIYYDRPLGDRYRYLAPVEVTEAGLGPEYQATMDWLFGAYTQIVARLVPHFEEQFPQGKDDSDFVWKSTIRAKACDAARGLLPAATTSNVGIYGTGQAYESLLLRMRAHPLAEANDYSQLMLEELRKVIPAFVKRVDIPGRGGVWSAYLANIRAEMNERSSALGVKPEIRPEVVLTDWDPDGELKVAAAALYAHSDLPDDQLLGLARELPGDARAELIRTYAGDRTNRRHKPGRGMERTGYRFDILCDYGIFRDLQRHRLMSLDWQRLSTQHGYVTPAALQAVGGVDLWDEAMDRAAHLAERIDSAVGLDAAQYAVPFAYKIRFYMDLNAREAFHLLELRTAQGGHADYRRVCQEMHRLIRDQAGHTAIADAMSYVDYNDYELGRLESERRSAAKRRAAGVSEPAAQ
ncbi:MAG: FAD-dependent thymidylate synthase [Acidimicrobiia bacterium]|nr:FAD-dependent thymidylate synthase [Acidimicrobiia bacterium]